MYDKVHGVYSSVLRGKMRRMRKLYDRFFPVQRGKIWGVKTHDIYSPVLSGKIGDKCNKKKNCDVNVRWSLSNDDEGS